MLVQRDGTSIAKNVESASKTVIGVNQAIFIHNGVVHLAGRRGIVRRRGWNIEADFF